MKWLGGMREGAEALKRCGQGGRMGQITLGKK